MPVSFMSFVTGNRAYGLPGRDSDIDLVALASKELREMADQTDSSDPDYENLSSISLRFGQLNLLCLYDAKQYEIWRDGTEALKKQAPVSRAFACKFFDRLREGPGPLKARQRKIDDENPWES